MRGAEFELIQKPDKRRELATKVRQVIEGPTGIGTHGVNKTHIRPFRPPCGLFNFRHWFMRFTQWRRVIRY